MRFEQYKIAQEIKDSLADLGLKRPTDIQFKAIPSILKGEDVLAIASTGTGKTAAFAIPIIHFITEWKKRKDDKGGIACLVMVPTRELSVQIAKVFNEIGKRTKVHAFSLHGGVEQDQQIYKLKAGVDVLVATPGRMFDLIYQKKINLNFVKVLVLDEADKMLDLGFYKDIKDVKKFLPDNHQTLYFSATISEKIKDLAYSLVRNPIRIQVSPQNAVSKNVSHVVVAVSMDDKRAFLERIINENPTDKMMVFVRTKVRAERVAAAMLRVGIKTLTMHGDKEQEDRQEALRKFNAGEVNIFIATDVSARGVHIESVKYVINYDLPDDPENYVHRVGRTGRGMQKGYAISFCSPEERPLLDDIEAYLGLEVQQINIDRKAYEQILFDSAEVSDWRTLLKEEEKRESSLPKKKFKKK